MVKIAPSILSCDFSKLGDEIARTDKTSAEYIHIDVMDGVFVRNITLGAPIIKAIRKFTKKVFDVHLMITEPIRYIDDFANAGADIITVHAEACSDIRKTLEAIKGRGLKAGLSIKPYTEPSLIYDYLKLCDMVLVMSVEPGFGGQSLISHSLENAMAIKKMLDIKHLDIPIEMDGGINAENAAKVASSGVTVLVAGSSVYKYSDIGEAVDKIRDAANSAILG